MAWHSPGLPSNPVSQMPEPGDLIAAFGPQPGQCFRMVQSRQLQATHCYERAGMEGAVAGRQGGWWYVEACREHAPKHPISTEGSAPSRPDYTL
jgi:hypothetical protein